MSVLGASGSGKSSLVRAGLLPELIRQPMEGMRDPRVLVIRPGANPLQRLADVLTRLTGAPSTMIDAKPALLDRVDALHRAAQAPYVADSRVIVFVDQFEELFTECTSETARAAFLATLAHAAAHPDGVVSVVFAMRNDFAGSLAAYDGFAWAVRERRFTVSPMSRQQLIAAIEQPARALGHPWPFGLVENLVLQCEGRPGALPLLQFALKRLWPEHVADRLARSWSSQLIEDYVVQVANALVEKSGCGQEHVVCERIIRRAFLAMVQLGEGAADTRRVARLSEIVARGETSEQVRAVLAPFVAPETRLVTASELDGEPTYEIAHEALIGAWDQLREWLGHVAQKTEADTIRGALRLRQRLRHAVRGWQDDRGALIRPPELESAVSLRARDPEELSLLEHALIAASSRAWRAHRRRWVYAAVAAFVLVAIAGLIGWDLYYRPHVGYYRDYVRRWGEPEGIDPLTESEAEGRASTVKLVRRGHRGHVVHVELVAGTGELARANVTGAGYRPELEIGQKSEGEWMPCQWDFAYESDTDTVSSETARDRTGRVIYRLQYRSGPASRRKAEFIDENGDDATIKHGDAERVEFVRHADQGGGCGLPFEVRWARQRDRGRVL